MSIFVKMFLLTNNKNECKIYKQIGGEKNKKNNSTAMVTNRRNK